MQRDIPRSCKNAGCTAGNGQHKTSNPVTWDHQSKKNTTPEGCDAAWIAERTAVCWTPWPPKATQTTCRSNDQNGHDHHQAIWMRLCNHAVCRRKVLSCTGYVTWPLGAREPNCPLQSLEVQAWLNCTTKPQHVSIACWMSPVHLSRHRQPPAFLPLAWLMTKRRINQKVRPNSISSFQVRSLEQNPDSKSLIPASTAAPSSGEGFMSSISWWASSLPSERWMILDERESQRPHGGIQPTAGNPENNWEGKWVSGRTNRTTSTGIKSRWTTGLTQWGSGCCCARRNIETSKGWSPNSWKTRRLVSLMLATTAGPKAIWTGPGQSKGEPVWWTRSVASKWSSGESPKGINGATLFLNLGA